MIRIASKHNVQTLSWLTISNIVGSLSQWCLLIILVKFFSTEDVGYFTYGMALAAPVFMLTDMQMKSVLIVEPFGENDNFRTYQLIRFFTTTFATIGLITYSVLFREVNWIILIVITYKASESLTDILNGYLQKCDRMIWMSKLAICKTITALSMTFILTLILQQVVTTLSSLVIVSLIYYLIINRYINRIVSLRFAPKWSEILDIVKKSLPLGISVFLGSYITNFPRLTIESLEGPEMLAYFGAYSYLAIGLFQIHVPIQIFLRQRLSVDYQNNDIKGFTRKVNTSVLGFICLGSIIFLILLFGGKFIIKIIYNESYYEYFDVLLWLLISQTMLSVTNVFSISILSFNVYTRQAFISGSALAVVILLSNFLIGKYSIYGACYISIIAACISFLSYSFIYYKRLTKWKAKV